MRPLIQQLWKDDTGAVLAFEWVYLASLLILGILTGLIAIRQAVISEMTEYANALLVFNDSFSFSGTSNCLTQQNGGMAISSPDVIQDGAVNSPDTEVIEQSVCD